MGKGTDTSYISEFEKFLLKSNINEEYWSEEIEKKYFKSKKNISIDAHVDPNNIIAGHKKTYKCEICGKSFTKGDSLKTHINIVHEGQQKIPCDHCEKTFTRKADMRRHVLNIHEGIKPYKCDLCPKECFLFKNFRGHYQRVHEKDISKNDLKYLKPFEGGEILKTYNILDPLNIEDEGKIAKVLYHSTETKFLERRGLYLRGSGSKAAHIAQGPAHIVQEPAHVAQGPAHIPNFGDEEDLEIPEDDTEMQIALGPAYTVQEHANVALGPALIAQGPAHIALGPVTEMTGIKIGGQFTEIKKQTVDIKDVINQAENQFKQKFGSDVQSQNNLVTINNSSINVKNEIPKVKRLVMYPRNMVNEKEFEKFDENMTKNIGPARTAQGVSHVALEPAHTVEGPAHIVLGPALKSNIGNNVENDEDLEILGESITKRYKTKYKYLCNNFNCDFSSYDSKEMLNHAKIHTQPKDIMPTLTLGRPIQPKGMPISYDSNEMLNHAKIHEVKKISSSLITPQQILAASNSNIKIVTKTGVPPKKFENKVAHIAQVPAHVAQGLVYSALEPAQKRQWPINDIKSVVTKITSPLKTNIKVIDMTKNAEKNQGNGNIYPCGNCNLRFLTVHELTRHVASHVPENPAEVIDLVLDNDDDHG